jgi:D-glycero-D-manno-heptose 1,7-bisphosphate phosphatase
VGVDAVNRAVFLDRDGVITRAHIRNGRPYAARARADAAIVPGVADALDRLHRAGLLLIVVTNQPDVARGRLSRSEVEAIHAGLRAELPLDDIHVCYHDDADECACRKPAPGMLYAAAVAHDIALPRSYLVGDRWRDIAAGRRAGCQTILVESGHDEPVLVEPDARVADLDRAAAWILAHERS